MVGYRAVAGHFRQDLRVSDRRSLQQQVPGRGVNEYGGAVDPIGIGIDPDEH